MNDDLTLLRELDIIGDRKRGIPAIFPVSRSHFRQLIRDGKFPKPIKHGALSFWRKSDVLAYIKKIVEGQ